MKRGSHDLLQLGEDGWRIGGPPQPKRKPGDSDFIRAKKDRGRRFAALCARYGKKPGTVRARMQKRQGKRRMTLREALRTPLAENTGRHRRKKANEWDAESKAHYSEHKNQ